MQYTYYKTQYKTQYKSQIYYTMEDLISRMHYAPGTLAGTGLRHERPLQGTTMFVATCPLKLRGGVECVAHVFQDITDKQYIITLAFGDVTHGQTMYTRIHSSCVTSETLRACDCDCAQQLDGAIDIMAKAGSGVLFYLLQEGRGVGYIAKSRDRMLVQASADSMTTFEAYERMGLKRDHRMYHNIVDICYMLHITSDFILLTNNPAKIDAFRAHGLRLSGTQAISFDPSPYNVTYLSSKARSGHTLTEPAAGMSPAAGAPSAVVPFAPRAVPGAERFVYVASYFLPIRITEGDVCSWFRVHVYYDIVCSSEFVVLTFGDVKGCIPLVRIHSESLFDRFPLLIARNREKLQQSMRTIVSRGAGVIILLYDDGRDAGFGAHAVDRMLSSQGHVSSSEKAYELLAIEFDRREYAACIALIRQHITNMKIRMIVSSPSSIVRKCNLIRALSEQNIDVIEWVFIRRSSDDDLLTIDTLTLLQTHSP